MSVKHKMDTENCDFKITTMTVCSDFLNVKIDLFNICKYIPIDDNIIGIKCNYGGKCIVRGAYSTCKNKNDLLKMTKGNFYNQISLLMRKGSTGICNVKLFGNGAVQMTGCKSKNDALVAMGTLHKSLVQLSNETEEIMLSKDTDGVYVDKHDFVYGTNHKRVIGYKTNETYIIGNKAYNIDKRTGLFISCKKVQGVQEILDFDGQLVGTKCLKVSSSVKRVYNNNSSTRIIDDVVFFSNENVSIVLGHHVYKMKSDDWEEKFKAHQSRDEVMLYDYRKSPFYGPAPGEARYNVQIHCGNVTFDLKQKIDRDTLSKALLRENYLCKYNPQIYAGVKFTYKIPLRERASIGLCECNNKCTCSKVTFLIFHSGKVIVTGFKDESVMAPVIASFKEILKRIYKVQLKAKNINL